MQTKHKFIETKFQTSTDADSMTFKGYAAIFGNVDHGGDVIEPGAFKEYIQRVKTTGEWPAMLAQHGSLGSFAGDNTPIGVFTDIKEDDKGLYVEGKLANTPRGREYYELMKMEPRPALRGMSIGYIAVKWQHLNDKRSGATRLLQKIDLSEISIVTSPMNPKAVVSNVKSVSIRIAERALRDAGFSRAEAKAALAKRGKSQLGLRDAGEDAALCNQLKQIIKTIKS